MLHEVFVWIAGKRLDFSVSSQHRSSAMPARRHSAQHLNFRPLSSSRSQRHPLLVCPIIFTAPSTLIIDHNCNYLRVFVLVAESLPPAGMFSSPEVSSLMGRCSFLEAGACPNPPPCPSPVPSFSHSITYIEDSTKSSAFCAQ